MSGPGDDHPGNGLPPSPQDGGSVLANLPRSRPQRSSARRDAARSKRLATEHGEPRKARAIKSATAAPAKEKAKAGADRRAKPRPDHPDTQAARRTRLKDTEDSAPQAARRTRLKDAEDPVPPQGFECEGERATGAVQPPGSTELLASAAEALGEIAKFGFSTGERLLRDVISLLPRS
ncbi:MAG TPA: hypothetical protein VGG08_00050 [Solirubrobacteraceae bacterium]|jgi:hypothetical protein